jgi:uncharacterized protein (DUF305 family)
MRILETLSAAAIVSFALAGPAAAQMGQPADQAMTADMDKMQHDMTAAPMTGDADQDFVAMMLPHHAGAVDMAKAELQYGKDPQMRDLARNIIAAQDKEIAEMQDWQAAHPAK